MKAIIAMVLLGLLAGCTSSTEYGSCVGIGEKQKPDLEYKISAWNLVIGIVFFELIAPPVVVAVDETFCPIGKN